MALNALRGWMSVFVPPSTTTPNTTPVWEKDSPQDKKPSLKPDVMERDCGAVYIVCLPLLVTSIAISYSAIKLGDRDVVYLSLFSGLGPAIAMLHCKAISWHLGSLQYHQESLSWHLALEQYKQKRSKEGPDLLAAPLAWTIWSLISFVILVGFVVWKLPVAVQNHPIKISYIPASSRIIVILKMIAGIAHIAFNTISLSTSTVLSANSLDEDTQSTLTGSVIPNGSRIVDG